MGYQNRIDQNDLQMSNFLIIYFRTKLQNQESESNTDLAY